jgi:isocitrate dehydrogenase
LGESLKFLAAAKGNPKAKLLGEAVEVATQGILDHNKSPGRKVGQPDNRDSHFFFALYWSQALAEQTQDADLAAYFAPMAKALGENEATIVAEFASAQGTPAETGGYYHADPAKTTAVMRTSATFNQIIG